MLTGMEEFLWGCQNVDGLVDKGKTTFVKAKKVHPTSRIAGQSEKEKRVIYCQNPLVKPVFHQMRLDNRGFVVGRIEQMRSEVLGHINGNEKLIRMADPITYGFVVMPPLGQNIINPNDLYVDPGFGLNKVDIPQPFQELMGSSSGKEGDGSQDSEKRVDDILKQSYNRGVRGRGRRRVRAPSSHGMCTRRTSKHSALFETDGSELELEDNFSNVIEESVVRGVSFDEANQFYGKDDDYISWNVRGLGQPEKRLVVSKHVKKLKSSFLLLLESNVRSVDYRCSIILGELAILKKKVVICNLYALNVDIERVELWEFIVVNQRRFSVPWIVRDVMELAKNTWKLKSVVGSKGFVLAAKLRTVKKVFKWLQNEVKLEDRSSNNMEVSLEVVELSAKVSSWNAKLRAQRRKIMAEMWADLLKEERNWRQKAKVKWFMEGDRNSNFFHMVCNSRRHRNFIDNIAINSVLCVGPNQVREGIFNFFKNQLRLRNMANEVIGKAQMAFVARRQIIDSFVIANEVLSSWTSEKEGGIMLKLNFEKAYDSVDHKFLDSCLEVVFPRIYALAVNKTGMVSEFGNWIGSVWDWQVATRRPILGWEESVWFIFLSELDKFRIRKPNPDSLIWTLTPFSKFLSGVVPLKVDLFIWMLANQRVLVGELLPKFTASPLSSSILIRNLKVGCVDVIKKKRKVSISWSLPLERELKFNVDEPTRGKPGRSGI
ncbi:hypothetical protein Ddye_030340 [Dipteronia dyeriana]|uniref:Reverse transcriptase domain-containing protein n=1 Tax=Dipteronia dyeriana TaxID=168575 RepID=A0AAD9TGS0_9ROSI|nr:hypothetical protein Ddye_030340 [Dipteronia dyeriana]